MLNTSDIISCACLLESRQVNWNISVERRSRDGSETEEQSESKQAAKSGSFGRGKTECSDKYEYDKSDSQKDSIHNQGQVQ